MTSNLTHDVDHCDTRLKTYIPNYSLFQIWHTRTTTARPAAYMRLIRLSMCLYGTPSFPYPNITVVSSPNKYNKSRRSFQTFYLNAVTTLTQASPCVNASFYLTSGVATTYVQPSRKSERSKGCPSVRETLCPNWQRGQRRVHESRWMAMTDDKSNNLNK